MSITTDVASSNTLFYWQKEITRKEGGIIIPVVITIGTKEENWRPIRPIIFKISKLIVNTYNVNCTRNWRVYNLVNVAILMDALLYRCIPWSTCFRWNMLYNIVHLLVNVNNIIWYLSMFIKTRLYYQIKVYIYKIKSNVL